VAYIEKNVVKRPPQRCYRSALKYKAVKYWRIHRKLDDMKACIVSGFPFVLGFSAHRRFHDEVRLTGILEMPAKGERLWGATRCRGAMTTEAGRLVVRNSWARSSGCRATSRCHTSTCSKTTCRLTSGR